MLKHPQKIIFASAAEGANFPAVAQTTQKHDLSVYVSNPSYLHN